jgi:hypothetical protein
LQDNSNFRNVECAQPRDRNRLAPIQIRSCSGPAPVPDWNRTSDQEPEPEPEPGRSSSSIRAGTGSERDFRLCRSRIGEGSKRERGRSGIGIGPEQAQDLAVHLEGPLRSSVGVILGTYMKPTGTQKIPCRLVSSYIPRTSPRGLSYISWPLGRRILPSLVSVGGPVSLPRYHFETSYDHCIVSCISDHM